MGTIHGTSRRRPWLWMVSPRGFLLPAGCRSSFSRQAPILKQRRRRYKGEIGKKGFVLGVSSARGKYRRRGHQGDTPVSQEAPWRGLGWGHARDPSGLLVVAPLPSLDSSGSFQSADFLSDFSGIFGALLMAGKPEI